MLSILKVFSGSHYRRFNKKAQPLVRTINTLEEGYQKLSEAELRGLTEQFKARYQAGETLDDLLPEAFAAVKNGARRLCGQTFDIVGQPQTWNMVHYDVQLIGGMALHQGKIAEMATGEGKTLVATLPLYLNALTGESAQLVTVNDYLANRDSQWMGKLFEFMGLSVGCIQNSMPSAARKEAYKCDIVYGTASEFGFDYLRDNGMATRAEDQVQQGYAYCIVDEIDSILIDEARTPLIISGPSNDERAAPFKELKGDVAELRRKQHKLCATLITEAATAHAAAQADKKAEREHLPEALTRMLQVKLGDPRNKQLMKLLEDNPTRRAFDAYDAEMHSDYQKQALFALKEDLYYSIDEKGQQADLTEKGRETLRPNNPDAFLLPDLPTTFVRIEKDAKLNPEQKLAAKTEAENIFIARSEEIHCLSQLLRAYTLYERDVQYVVQEGKVNIVDENTGRLMPGRRWSDGLHQAVEAKENVAIEKETKTYASITIQNYFRMYGKLAGMTGTAETEAGEFWDIYKLEVMAIPTHRPCVREDFNDVIYKTRREKYQKAMEDIAQAHKEGQPVLVGTTSVEASEVLSRMLKGAKVPHKVLNAKFHQQEAEIVADAGQLGAVTIATNMAGRGTDIKLADGVDALGGLLVLGTERHESRRIDRQLRGRCARQGDRGQSKFYISLEDNLMRLFANAGPISRLLEKSFQPGEELEHPLLNRSIESAQKKVEAHHYSIRKRLLQFDDVLNQQREIIYALRNEALVAEQPYLLLRELIEESIGEALESTLVEAGISTSTKAARKQPLTVEVLASFLQHLQTTLPIPLSAEQFSDTPVGQLVETVLLELDAVRTRRMQTEASTPEALVNFERYVLTAAIDNQWQDHLTEMEELRRSVGLRSYGQKDPLNEYKAEAYTAFSGLMARTREDVVTRLFRPQVDPAALEQMLQQLAAQAAQAEATGPADDTDSLGVSTEEVAGAKRTAAANRAPGRAKPKPQPIVRELPKIGRNDVVTIRRGPETQEVKFKKAETLIANEGWQLVQK